jgi:hypothetical protein
MRKMAWDRAYLIFQAGASEFCGRAREPSNQSFTSMAATRLVGHFEAKSRLVSCHTATISKCAVLPTAHTVKQPMLGVIGINQISIVPNPRR